MRPEGVAASRKLDRAVHHHAAGVKKTTWVSAANNSPGRLKCGTGSAQRQGNLLPFPFQNTLLFGDTRGGCWMRGRDSSIPSAPTVALLFIQKAF